MIIVCRIFSGLMPNGTYADRFLPEDKGLVYVIDELALKAESRHNPDFQHFQTLMDGEPGHRLLDEVFHRSQGYDILNFISKFVKPVLIMTNDGQPITISKKAWPSFVQQNSVLVNVQDNARSIATPATGLFVKNVNKPKLIRRRQEDD